MKAECLLGCLYNLGLIFRKLAIIPFDNDYNLFTSSIADVLNVVKHLYIVVIKLKVCTLKMSITKFHSFDLFSH